jgi:hypothetical protein
VIPADRSGNEIRSRCDILSSIPLSSGCKSQSNDLPEGEGSRIPCTSCSPPMPRQFVNVSKFFRQNRMKSLSWRGGGRPTGRMRVLCTTIPGSPKKRRHNVFSHKERSLNQ